MAATMIAPANRSMKLIHRLLLPPETALIPPLPIASMNSIPVSRKATERRLNIVTRVMRQT